MNAIGKLIIDALVVALLVPAVRSGIFATNVQAAAAPGWNVVMVDNGAGDRGRRPSIAIHPITQQPSVSYYDAGSGALRLAQYAGASGTCTAYGWNCAELDGYGHAGEWSSLRFVPGGNGAYAIAYTDPDHADIKLRRVAADGSHTVQNLAYTHFADEGVGPADGGNDLVNSPSLAFQGGQPMVAFYRSFREINIDGDTRNSGLQVEDVDGFQQDREDTRFSSDEDEVSDHGLFASLDIDANSSRFRVAYRERDNQTLKYAQPVESGGTGCFWTDNVLGQKPSESMRCDVVDPTAKTGSYITLIAPHTLVGGGKNATQIAYYDGAKGQVKYAKFVGGNSTCGAGGTAGWQCVVIDNVGTYNGPMGVSMALDSNGSPVIAYYDRNDTSHGVLKVARLAGNELGNCGPKDLFHTWKCTVVDDGGASDDVGQYAAVALDASGKAYVAYYNSSYQALMVAHEKSTSVPSFAKAYTPATITQGGVATMKFTISNNMLNTSLTGVTFGDGLTGHTLNKNSLTTSNCGGSDKISFPTTNAIKLTGGIIPASSTCVITVQVQGTNAGKWTDPASTLKSNEAHDVAGATATLYVNAPAPATPIATPPTKTPTETSTPPPAETPPTGTPPVATATPTPLAETPTPVTPAPSEPTIVPMDPPADSSYRVYLPNVQR